MNLCRGRSVCLPDRLKAEKLENFDVVVIGAGVVGCAVARELTRYHLKVCVLEKELDVACGNSSRNSGVLHAGFTYRTGSLRAKLAVVGNKEFDQVADELDVPFRRTGKLVIGYTEHDRQNILKFMENGRRNGVENIRMIDKEEIRKIESHAGGEFAMFVPSTGIMDPMQYTIGLAENAADNGAIFRFDACVTGIMKSDSLDCMSNCYKIQTEQGEVSARWVINCAGTFASEIAEMLGYAGYCVHGFKGEYFVLDKKAGKYLSLPVYPAPNDKGSFATHATPTLDGNVLIGPDSYPVDEKEDYANTKEHLDGLLRDGAKMFTEIRREYFVRNFAGIRWKNCSPETGDVLDFRIDADERYPHTINLVGIESPGLTAALPLARRAVHILLAREEEEGRTVSANESFNPRRQRFRRFTDMSAEEQEKAIQVNPDYGEIVCRCENVTRAEILNAIHNPLGVHTLTGIKNRTRAMMGRCQSGYCQVRITEMLETELGIQPEDLRYQRRNGWLFTGKVRDL